MNKSKKKIYILAITQFSYNVYNGQVALGQPIASWPFFFSNYDYAYEIYDTIVSFHEENDFSIQEHMTKINSKGCLAIHPREKRCPAISIELYPEAVDCSIDEIIKVFGGKEETDPIDDIMRSVGIDPNDNPMDEEFQKKIKAKSNNLLDINEMRKIIEERMNKKNV